MNTVNVGILGLRRLGGSIGLALRRYSQSKDARQQFSVTGYDPDERLTTRAKSIGAIDNVARNLSGAARDRDIVVLALPFHETEAAYQLIGRDLKPGVVVLDMSPYKQPSLGWAKKYCGEEVYLVGVTPVINARYLLDGLDDLDHAAEDYFDKGTMLISPSPAADRDAVQLATDFAQILGSAVRFTDPPEHDAWATVMEALPAALGIAVFDAISQRESWDDVRRVGNAAFGQLTHHLIETHPDALRNLLLRDREGLIRQIDSVVTSLNTMRALLAENDRDALEALLVRSRDNYVDWLVRRRSGEWDPTSHVEREVVSETLMTNLFGSAIAKRLKRGGNVSDS